MAKTQKSSKLGVGILVGGIVVVAFAVFFGPKLDRPKAKPRPNVYEGVSLAERRLQVVALEALRPKVRRCYSKFASENAFLEGIIVVSFVAEWYDGQGMFPEVRLEAPRSINTKSLEDKVAIATRRVESAKTPRLSDEERLADAEAQLKEATDANALVEKLDVCLKDTTKKLIFEVDKERDDGELALVFPFAFTLE